MPKIRISDLSPDQNVSEEELRKVKGGWSWGQTTGIMYNDRSRNVGFSGSSIFGFGNRAEDEMEEEMLQS